MNQHTRVKPFSGAILFDSVDDMLACMFGAPEQDAHVGAWRQHQKSKALISAYKDADALFAAKHKQYGSYAAWFRAEPAKFGSR